MPLLTLLLLDITTPTSFGVMCEATGTVCESPTTEGTITSKASSAIVGRAVAGAMSLLIVIAYL